MKRHLAIPFAILVAGLFALPVAAIAAERHHDSRQAAWSGHDGPRHDRDAYHHERGGRWEREGYRDRRFDFRHERRWAWRDRERRDYRAERRVVVLPPPPPRAAARILLPPPPLVILGSIRLW